MTDADLDKLEALAVALRVSWSGRGWVASKKIDGLLKEARQAADGLTSLIASARRDAEEIERLKLALESEKLNYDGALSDLESAPADQVEA